MYLNLLEKVVTNEIYENLPTKTGREVSKIKTILSTLKREGIDFDIEADILTDILQYTKKSRNLHTYVSRIALRNIRHLLDIIHAEEIDGDVMDCGVLRGGTSIYMAGVLKHLHSARKLYVADTFEGLPRPTLHDGLFANEFWYRFSKDLPEYNLDCTASLEAVKENFSKYDLLDDRIHFVKGLFSETLPALPSALTLSLVRIDVDWYQSTLDVLTPLYDRIAKGGFVIIDDYKLPGCKQAVDEFRARHGIGSELQPADEEKGVVYWRK